MALLWFDGFDSYDTIADLINSRSPIINAVTQLGLQLGTAYGRRTGSIGLQITYNYAGQYIKYDLVANYTSFILGCACRIKEAGPVTAITGGFINFLDGTTNQLIFILNSSYEIDVYCGSNLLGTTVGAGLTLNTWRYIEVKFTIDSSGGSVIVRSDNKVILTLSGEDTQNTANAYINKIVLSGTNPHKDMWFDDMYWCDLTGDAPHNDFLGDVRADVIRPDGEGTYNADFTGSPDVSSNLNVDETYGPDEDTSYNQGSDVGDKDTYTLGNLPSPAGTTIHGVKSQITIKKSDAGAREVKLLTRAGTTDDLGDAIVLSTSYLTHSKIYEDNPDDSNSWEDADVNALEIGVEITV